MCHIVPFIDQSSNDLLELFKKLYSAFTLLLRGKCSLKSSDDICVQWKVLLRYLQVYLCCLDLNKEKIVFNDSFTLESSGLLYLSLWNHHQFEMRILGSLSLPNQEQMSAVLKIVDVYDSNDLMFFISTAWFYTKVVAFPLMRVSATIKLLDLSKGSDYKTNFIDNLLNDVAYKLGFSSCDLYLLALVDIRLLSQWPKDIEEIPFLLFGFSSLSDFLLHTLEHSLPRIIHDSKWELMSLILSSAPSAPMIFRQNLSRILVELALDLPSLEELVNISYLIEV
jgi:hypothetical protein